MDVIHVTPAIRTGSVAPRSAVSTALNVAATLLLMVLAILLAPWPVTVVDGDTVDRMYVRHRLAGFDAPEIRRAKCQRERERAQAAKARLAEIIAAAQRVELVRMQWKLDPWSRVLSRLEVDGVDVASIAIAEGWGTAYAGRGARRDWCGE